jgi:protein farnesyltransferase subunit beta
MINREKLYDWLISLKTEEGGFMMQKDGEVDVRGVYISLAVASLTGILDSKLKKNVSTFISKCQNYSGGISAYP